MPGVKFFNAQFVIKDLPSLYQWPAHMGSPDIFSEKGNAKHALLLGISFSFTAPLLLLRSKEARISHKLRGLWLCIVGLLKLPFYLLCTMVYGLIAGAYDLCCVLIKQPHPLLDKVFFVGVQLFGVLFFWVDVLVESVCSPFYTIWCLIMPVIYQSNQGSSILPPLAKGLILSVYGLSAGLIGGVVLSLLGVIPAMGLMPTALTVASGTLVQWVGQPLASVFLVLMGLHACAALAYLMRVAISRGLLIKQAWQMCRLFEQLNKGKGGESQTCYYERDDTKPL